jgi:ubiquinone/menaquinone biosynthesis C-methylase UbiE
MRLLDAGCGAGSITFGLACAVVPGEAAGIDINEEIITIARSTAEAQRVTNIRFQAADAAALPFDDSSFDAAFAHALLQHVESPSKVLSELRRVLRPGGVIGVADADFDGAIIWPQSNLLARAGEILAHTRRHPRIGKQLRSLLHDAGFVRTDAFVSGNQRGNANQARLDGEFWARYFEAEEFIAQADVAGWATRSEMLEIAAAWRAWGEDPGAFSATLWCQAIGWVPD